LLSHGSTAFVGVSTGTSSGFTSRSRPLGALQLAQRLQVRGLCALQKSSLEKDINAKLVQETGHGPEWTHQDRVR
jgi:hypothetical protein